MRKDNNWHSLTVATVRTLGTSVREITFDADNGALPFSVGSHIDFRVMLDGREDIRSYSLVGEPNADRRYRVAVRAMPDSRGGSRFMWTLQPGDRIEASAPSNNFELDEASAEILLIAGGIGVTPIVGMAQRLARSATSFRMLYAGRSREEMAYLDELQVLLGERLDAHCDIEQRFIDLPAEIERLHPSGEIYVCGPLGMLDAVRRHWHAAGRSRARLHFETFGNSGRAAAQPFVVKLPAFGIEVPVRENESMLDALNGAGIEILADCRRGECGLCAVKVLDTSGEIDHRDVFLSDEEHAVNHKICACVSRVAGGAISIDTGYRRDALPG
jgi:vanillate O-demethylase ferredoxin subunit